MEKVIGVMAPKTAELHNCPDHKDLSSSLHQKCARPRRSWRGLQGDTAIGISRTRKEVMREVTVQLLNGIDAPCRLAQDFQRDGRVKLVVEQSLMRGGVIRHDEGLVSLLKCRG